MGVRDWIARSWLRHPLSLRPYLSVRRTEERRFRLALFDNRWDEGLHAHTDFLTIGPVNIWRLQIEFGIKDSN